MSGVSGNHRSILNTGDGYIGEAGIKFKPYVGSILCRYCAAGLRGAGIHRNGGLAGKTIVEVDTAIATASRIAAIYPRRIKHDGVIETYTTART